jgi:hypothetical protein
MYVQINVVSGSPIMQNGCLLSTWFPNVGKYQNNYSLQNMQLLMIICN